MIAILNKELTAEDLDTMKPDTIFATGIVLDPRLYREEVRWLAVRRGYIGDWCIYYHHAIYSIEYVRGSGDKCFTREVIRQLVPCTDEAMERYAF